MKSVAVRTFLSLCVGLSSWTHAQAYWDEYKYLDVTLSDSDRGFMIDVQSRAEAWARAGNTYVYDGFRRPLSLAESQYRDSLQVLPSDSWRLEVLVSRSLDTLTVLALTRNVHYRLGTLVYRTEPRYSFPLSEYRNFLEREDLERLSTVVEGTLLQITGRLLYIGSEKLNSIEWRFSDHLDWQLFDQDLVRAATTRCADERSLTFFFDDPSLHRQLNRVELKARLVDIDTLDIVGGGRGTVEQILQAESIDLIVQLKRLPQPVGSSDVPFGFVSYVLSNTVIGLWFGNGLDRAVWAQRGAFVTCYGDPLIEGWLDAVVANQLEHSLQER